MKNHRWPVKEISVPEEMKRKIAQCVIASADEYRFVVTPENSAVWQELIQLAEGEAVKKYEIKSKGLVRLIYQSCGWDRTRSYRLPGVEYPQHRLVNYDLSRAIPIFEGKIDKEAQEAQRGDLR